MVSGLIEPPMTSSTEGNFAVSVKILAHGYKDKGFRLSDLQATTSVHELKALIEKQEGYSVEEQRIMYSRGLMRDGQLLQDYSKTQECVVIHKTAPLLSSKFEIPTFIIPRENEGV